MLFALCFTIIITTMNRNIKRIVYDVRTQSNYFSVISPFFLSRFQSIRKFKAFVFAQQRPIKMKADWFIRI